MENIYIAGESLKAASGRDLAATHVTPVYRKISITKIEVLDDTDVWSKGDFVCEALVNGVTLGTTEVQYKSTEQFLDYEFAIAVKHYPLTQDRQPNPLVVQFKADELDTAFLFFGSSKEKVADFRQEFAEGCDYGIEDEIKPFVNDYLRVHYTIEKLTESQFDNLEKIAGEVFTYDEANPKMKVSVDGALVRLFEVRKAEAASGKVESAPGDGTFVKQTNPRDDRLFDLTGLDVDVAYRVRITANGYSSFTHDFNCLHQFVRAPLSRICFNGKVVDQDKKALANADVHLYKTMVRLPKELPCFREGSTDKPIKIKTGEEPFKLDAGSYTGLEIKEVAGNRWARIQAAKLPAGTGWLCYGSGTKSWATMNATNTSVTLNSKLKCFETTDVRRPIQVAVTKDVRIAAGDYAVIATSLDSTKDADYVKIRSENLPYDEGWVCSRWRDTADKDHHTAVLYDTRIKDNAVKTDNKGQFSIRIEDQPDQLYRVRTVLQNHFDGESARKLPAVEKGKNPAVISMTHCDGIIEESDITRWLSEFEGWTYGLNVVPRYPAGWHIHDLVQYQNAAGDFVSSLKAAPPKSTQNGCNSFVEALLIQAWREKFGATFGWDNDKHMTVMIPNRWDDTEPPAGGQFDPTIDLYGPVTLAIGEDDDDVRMAIGVASDRIPPPWTVVQAWWKWNPTRVPPAEPGKPPTATDIGGHCFIIVDVHPETQRVLMLESNVPSKLNGPGFREAGHLDNFLEGDQVNPNKDDKFWWERVTVFDWKKFTATFPVNRRRMARLKVNNLRMVK
ncbi:MAG TPA: hypothetical protein VMY05_10090 [Acidobacteriota bacterium]|nr:hypothetical protein [Acidobacteriota bacterium]